MARLSRAKDGTRSLSGSECESSQLGPIAGVLKLRFGELTRWERQRRQERNGARCRQEGERNGVIVGGEVTSGDRRLNNELTEPLLAPLPCLIMGRRAVLITGGRSPDRGTSTSPYVGDRCLGPKLR